MLYYATNPCILQPGAFPDYAYAKQGKAYAKERGPAMGRPATGGKFLDHPHGPSVGIWRRAILYAGQGIVKPLGQGADLPLMDHRLFLAKH